eukprot:8528035-Prorocentrum_lima.AAC.1
MPSHCEHIVASAAGLLLPPWRAFSSGGSRSDGRAKKGSVSMAFARPRRFFSNKLLVPPPDACH